MMAKSELNSTETLMSQALIHMEISHEEFVAILNEKDKYKKKENLRSENEKQEIMRLSSIKSKIYVKNYLVFYAIIFFKKIHSSKVIFSLCMYKMYTFSIDTWSKIDAEAITYDGKNW